MSGDAYRVFDVDLFAPGAGGAMPALRGTPTNSFSASKVTTLGAPTPPTGTVSGDLLVMMVQLESGSSGAPTVNPASVPGWDFQGTRAVNAETGGNASATTLTKIHDGSAMPTVSWDISAFPNITIESVSGADPADPVDTVSGYQVNSIGSAAPVPGLQTAQDNELLLAFVGNNWGLTTSVSTGWTKDFDDLETVVARSTTLAATANLVPNQPFTLNAGTHSSETQMLAINPVNTSSLTLTGTVARPWIRIIAYDGDPYAGGSPIGTWTDWFNIPGALAGPFVQPRTATFDPHPKLSGPRLKASGSPNVKTVKFTPKTRLSAFDQKLTLGVLGRTGRLSIFERPPIRHSVIIDAPSGRIQRWAADAQKAQNALEDATWGSTIPGGWDRMDCALFRKPELFQSDLEPFSRVTVYGAGGACVGQFRLEQTPETHGDTAQIQPGAVGYQSELDDNKDVAFVYVDAAAADWTEMSVARQIYWSQLGKDLQSISWQTEKGALIANLPNDSVPPSAYAESWYLMPPGSEVGSLQYVCHEAMPAGWVGPHVVGFDGNRDTNIGAATAYVLTADPVPTDVTLPATTHLLVLNTWPAIVFTLDAGGAASVGNKNFRSILPRVFGYTGLSPRPGTDGWSGVYGSDAVQHAIGKWTNFAFTTGVDGTIVPSSFPIPHLAFRDLGTVSDIVRGATRFGLEDWAVWESDKRRGQPVFWWHPRRYYGTTWRARVGPSKLNFAGTQVARVWNSVVVQYTDALTGDTKTVGPPGSISNDSSALLQDADPLNPATIAGKTRRALLQMQITTLEGAIKTGQIFLSEQKLLDSSGDAEFIGWVQDAGGVWHSAADVRAGDYVEFVDSNHTGARRIVKANWTEASKSMKVELDAPPDALAALLERLQVVLVPLGDG